jgi:hypothetical protein
MSILLGLRLARCAHALPNPSFSFIYPQIGTLAVKFWASYPARQQQWMQTETPDGFKAIRRFPQGAT